MLRNKLLLALALLIGFVVQANAALRFWNPYIVSGAISGTGGVCRLTISPAITGSGLLAGDNVSVTGITGATGCNVAATISTVVDTTHIEITGTTFGGAYVSGGCVGGGEWTNGNTSNWAASSTATCGSGGSSVPGSSDAVTFDTNSLAGTVVVCGPATANCPNGSGVVNIGSFVWGAFNGTLDFATRAPTITIPGLASTFFSGSGSGARTFNGGSSVLNINNSSVASSSLFSMNSIINLTNPTTAFASMTINLNNSAATSGAFLGGTCTFGTLHLVGASGFAGYRITGANTFSAITTDFTSGPITIGFAANQTINGGATSWTGTSTNRLYATADGIQTPIQITNSGGLSMSWAFVRGITASGATFTADHSFDLGENTSVTITNPPSGGGSCIGC